ncbi:MAG: hypothetical protein FJ215_05975 [Ignavibacteria bacterium]|nr:hypothetical protein [Ignavibacteria bacterium]
MNDLKNTLVLAIAVWLVHSAVYAQPKSDHGLIVGTVRDQETHVPLGGANVRIVGSNIGAATATSGAFRIEGIPPGTYVVRASMVGYADVLKTDVVVTSGRGTQLMIELSQIALELREITVQSSYFSRPQELATSSHILNFEEIRRSPGASEDVSRVMQSLPGVVLNTDLRNDLIVRGGSPFENYTSIDNLEIPTINHFATQGATGGSIGMVNTELIRDVTFLTGGFPAKYGDRLSSVMDIELREGNRDRTGGKVNLNAAGCSLIGEGPLGSNGSWLVSARRSYLDFLLKNFHFAGITIVPNYIDAQLKLTQDLTASDKLMVLFVGGVDDVKFQNVDPENMGINPDISGLDKVESDLHQWMVGGTWKRLWGTSGYSIVGLGMTENYYFTDIDDKDGRKTYRNRSVEREYGMKIDASFNLAKGNQVSFGAGMKAIAIDHEIFLKADTSRWANRATGSGIFPQLSYDKRFPALKLSGYVQYNRWFFNRWSLVPGLRIDYFNHVNHGLSISPRLAARFHVSEKSSFNASYGIYFQTPAYIWLTTDERNRKLKPIRSDHYIIGFEHLVQDDFKLTVDVYRKEYRDYPVSGYIPSYILVNGGSDAGAFIAGDLRSQGSGAINGVEIFLQKKLTTDYYGTVSYSYSVARYRALDGIERPGRFDYGHVFTFIGGYKISPTLEVSLRWRYAGGNPYTPIDESLSRLLGREVMDLNRINSSRFPAYHRLDVRTDYRFSLASLQWVAYMDLQNTYNQKNVYHYIWNKRDQKVVTVHQWSFLPVIGLSMEL